MSELEHNIDDELLSAYLDDELSLDERARVDARLASDPLARQLLDQLRSASQSVQSLPHESVGEDLRESILRRAEAAMLTSNGSGSAATGNQHVAAADKVGLRDSLPRITIGRTRRAWVWASLALAAGLLIMVFQPGDREGENLSQVAATRRAEEGVKLAATDRADVPELSKLRIAEPAAAPATADWAESDAAMPPAASAPLAGTASPVPESIAVDAPAAQVAPFGSSSTLSDDAGLATSGGALTARAPASVNRYNTPAEQPAREGGAKAEGPALGQLGDEARVAKDANGRLTDGVTKGIAPGSVAASGRELAETPPRGGLGGEMQFGAGGAGQPAPADAFSKAPAQASESDFLVVHVVVEPEALRSKAFDELLFQNGIQFEDLAEAGGKPESTSTTRGEASSDDRKLERAGGDAQDESGKQSAEEAVLVAAPRATIESFLAALKQDQQSYVGIAIDDPTTENTQDDDADKSTEEAPQPANKLATDLGTRFNRGSVPPQNLELARGKYFYDSDARQSQPAAGSRGFGGGGLGGARGAATKPEQEQLRARTESLGLDALGEKEQLDRGRARRIRSWGFDDGQNRDLSAIAGERGAEGQVRMKVREQLEAVPQTAQVPTETKTDDRLQVLFVLSPAVDQPAKTTPSPPAENRQE